MPREYVVSAAAAIIQRIVIVVRYSYSHNQRFHEHRGRNSSVMLPTQPTSQALTRSQLRLYSRFKRVFDVVAAALALLLLSPLLLLLAALIKLDSPGPALFKQTRIGKGHRPFQVYKFRSMRHNADPAAHRAYVQAFIRKEVPGEAGGGAAPFKLTRDPRITRVGQVLRATSLDELPQLINVLRGEMSLVGPRPMSVRDVTLFDRGIQRKRFSVRPGMTCLWQVSGRSNLPFSRWLELDLWYIEHWSLLLDLKILLRTIPAVLRGTGAQ